MSGTPIALSQRIWGWTLVVLAGLLGFGAAGFLLATHRALGVDPFTLGPLAYLVLFARRLCAGMAVAAALFVAMGALLLWGTRAGRAQRRDEADTSPPDEAPRLKYRGKP
jgi:hypothetical protein